jgi:hypothetical protein
MAFLFLAPVYPITDAPTCGNSGNLGAICLNIFGSYTVFKSASCVIGGVGAIYVPNVTEFHLGCSP